MVELSRSRSLVRWMRFATNNLTVDDDGLENRLLFRSFFAFSQIKRRKEAQNR